MTAGVLQEDPNTQQAKKNAIMTRHNNDRHYHANILPNTAHPKQLNCNKTAQPKADKCQTYNFSRLTVKCSFVA